MLTANGLNVEEGMRAFRQELQRVDDWSDNKKQLPQNWHCQSDISREKQMGAKMHKSPSRKKQDIRKNAGTRRAFAKMIKGSELSGV